MAKTQLISVEPAVLTWARRSIGYDVVDAARRLGLAPGRLVEFEEGAADPSIVQLRKMAAVYGRPLAAFFLDAPPRDLDVMRDFRRLPGDDREWSPDLHKLFRRVEAQQEVAAELLEEEGFEPEFELPSLDLRTPPEVGAGLAREALGVDLGLQTSWRSPHESLNGWISLVESAGVLVMQSGDVDLAEMRGFSLTSGPIPVVVLNGSDAPRGRVFTLAHEVAHLMLHQGGLCDMHEGPTSGDHVDVEAYCNEFAAGLLLPRSDFLAEPSVAAATAPREWDDEELLRLSERYGVSREAVLRRLVTVGRATLGHYLARRAEFLQAYDDFQVEQRRRAKDEGRKIIPQVATMTVRDLGKPYVRLVLDAYERRAITASTLSDYLGVRLKHVPKIADRVRP